DPAHPRPLDRPRYRVGVTPPRAAPSAPRPGARARLVGALRESDGLGRLSTARLAALLSEGIHQAALGGVVLFSPESATTPVAIVGGFAVLLLPYSVVGPFAAAALDRWDRRIVVAVAAVVRTVAIIATIALIAAGAVHTGAGLVTLFALSLVAIGLGRLINTGLTAAMPRVVPDRILAGTNSVLVTVGSVVTAVGAVAAFAILAVAGAGDAAVSWTLLPAVVTALLGAWAVLALPPRHLGPDDDEVSISGGSPLARDALGLFAGGLAEGVRAARSTHLGWVSLTAVSLGPTAFGTTTRLALLPLREAESIDGGAPVVAGTGGVGLPAAAGGRAGRATHRVWGSRTAGSLCRAAFGISSMRAILLLREAERGEGGVPVVAGMGGLGLLSAAVAGGMGGAALVAPWAMARTDRIL